MSDDLQPMSDGLCGNSMDREPVYHDESWPPFLKSTHRPNLNRNAGVLVLLEYGDPHRQGEIDDQSRFAESRPERHSLRTSGLIFQIAWSTHDEKQQSGVAMCAVAQASSTNCGFLKKAIYLIFDQCSKAHAKTACLQFIKSSCNRQGVRGPCSWVSLSWAFFR